MLRKQTPHGVEKNSRKDAVEVSVTVSSYPALQNVWRVVQQGKRLLHESCRVELPIVLAVEDIGRFNSPVGLVDRGGLADLSVIEDKLDTPAELPVEVATTGINLLIGRILNHYRLVHRVIRIPGKRKKRLL